MISFEYRWNASEGWCSEIHSAPEADLILVFSDHSYFKTTEFFQELRSFFPAAQIVGCSSSGNILNNTVSDQDIIVLAIKFDDSQIIVKNKIIDESDNINDAVIALVNEFPKENLKHVFLLSDGFAISGNKLTNNLNNFSIPVTGGLAGDATRFLESWVMANGVAKQRQVALVGFYGKIEISYGVATGWTDFGPERRITKSIKNTVYEIDHRPALDIYVSYLGALADDLPSSGLRFPLSIKTDTNGSSIVRTLLGINKNEKSLIFAAEIPENSLCSLMKTDIDALIESSNKLAQNMISSTEPNYSLCIVVSCVGRRLVMGQIAEEEIESIQNTLGSRTKIFGFYSYGEVAPLGKTYCSLHNQTTTLTLFKE